MSACMRIGRWSAPTIPAREAEAEGWVLCVGGIANFGRRKADRIGRVPLAARRSSIGNRAAVRLSSGKR